MFSRRPGFRFNRGRVAVGPVAPGGGGGDTDPPALSSDPAVGATGLYIDFTFDEAMDSGVPSHSAFTLGGTPVLPIAAGSSWQSTTVFRQALDSPILGSETVTVSCASGTFKDVALNDHPALSSQATDNQSNIELETVLDTYMSSGSLTPNTHYAPHRSMSWVVDGAGGGGDGGVTNGASGGAGEKRFDTIADASVAGYSWTLGAAGVAGSAGTATAGGNTVVTDVASGAIITAIGGSPGNSTGPTGGVGGTGGSGGTGRAGGAGSAGIGNRAGGATSGTSTAASGATPGEPQGIPGATGDTNLPGRGVGGGVRNGTPLTGRDGGAGIVVAIYQRAVVAGSRPRVTAIAFGRDIGNATARDVSLGGATSGTAVVQAAADGAAGGSSMSGYTELLDADSGGTVTGLVYARDLTGTDGVALATANERVNWRVDIVQGTAAASCSLTSLDAGNTAAPDPPSHDHGSAVDALWFAGWAGNIGASQSVGPTSWPASYEARFRLHCQAINNASAALATCLSPLLATQIENPGAYAVDPATASLVWTLCVPGV